MPATIRISVTRIGQHCDNNVLWEHWCVCGSQWLYVSRVVSRWKVRFILSFISLCSPYFPIVFIRWIYYIQLSTHYHCSMCHNNLISVNRFTYHQLWIQISKPNTNTDINFFSFLIFSRFAETFLNNGPLLWHINNCICFT